MRATAEIIRQAISYGLPLVLDADALYLLTQEPYKDLLNEDVSSPRDKTQQQQQQQQRTIILTPNAVELKRLKEAIEECSEGEERRRVQESYHGVIVVQKGQYDNIFFFSSLFNDGSLGTSRNNTIPPAAVMICKEEGGLKRSGGLGDILSGSIGTFLAWHQLMMKKQNNPSSTSDDISQLVLTGKEKLVPCWAACCIVKLATKAAYYKKRRAMTAPDVLEEIGEVVDKAITSHFD
jgi:ATP-dependent NAD(P)H-hydrate dehydratase